MTQPNSPFFEEQQALRVFNLYNELRLREYGMSVNLGKRLYTAKYTVDQMCLSYAMEILPKKLFSNYLEFSRAGDLLYGSYDRHVAVWDWTDAATKFELVPGHSSNIVSCKVIEKRGCFDVVSACQEGEVRHSIVAPSGMGQPNGDIGTAPNRFTSVLYKHNSRIRMLCNSPTDSFDVLGTGDDGQLRQFDLRMNSSSLLATVTDTNGRNVAMSGMVHHPYAPQVCVYGDQNTVRIYDKRHMDRPLHNVLKPKSPFDVTNGAGLSVEYNCLGTELLVAYNNNFVHLYDLKSETNIPCAHKYRGLFTPATTPTFRANYFGNNSEMIVSSSCCGHIFMWDKDTEALIKLMHCGKGFVPHILRCHPTLPVIAAATFHSLIQIFEPKPDGPKNMDAETINAICQKNILSITKPTADGNELQTGIRMLMYTIAPYDPYRINMASFPIRQMRH